MNLLVETKNEYTAHLVNTLTNTIYEGIQSIYKDALASAEHNEVLRVFQKYLREIPKWNQMIIDKETDRIVNVVQGNGWIEDLARATLKANLAVLMYNPTMKSQPKLDTSVYKTLKLSHFIHVIYVECARELWNNPYLFYHNYPPIDIKRNQKESIILIKDCIREAVRKLLPIKSILAFYLADDEIPISNDLNAGLEQDILNKPLVEPPVNQTEQTTPIIHTNLLIPYVEPKTESASLGTKILNIYNDKQDSDKQDKHSSDKHSSDKQHSYKHSSDKQDSYKQDNNKHYSDKQDKQNSTIITDQLLSTDFVNSTKQFNKSELASSPVNGEEHLKKFNEQNLSKHVEPDQAIKNVLNDLGTNTEDVETSINNKYYEVFSNSVGTEKKQEYFNNYLKL